MNERKVTPLLDAIRDEQERRTLKRQELIKKIQEKIGRKLIVYTANFSHPNSSMQHSDITPFEDLLIDVDHVESLDLMIDSPGGDPNIVEKLLMMCRERCNNFRVIVPNTAKSAATLITLGSDKIVMGYLSELGLIDPQIRIISPEGVPTFVPAQSIIDGFEDFARGLKIARDEASELDPMAYLQVLSRLDAPTYDQALKAQELTKKFARDWLVRYMHKGNRRKADKIAEELSNVKKWLSHGKVINCKLAKEIIGSEKIIELPRDDELWQLIWELYILSERHLQTAKRAKLFESENVSVHQ